MVEAFFVIAAECDRDASYVYKLSGQDFAEAEPPALTSTSYHARNLKQSDEWEEWPDEEQPAKCARGEAGSSAMNALDLDSSSDEAEITLHYKNGVLLAD